MVKKVELELITLEWEGPLTLDEVKFKNGTTDYGVYQIYGTHNILGPNSLLYIGQANKQTFGTRISQHNNWLTWEPSELKIYVGRCGGVNPEVSLELWEQQIDKAEKMLIYYCTPPYNSSSIIGYGDIKYTMLLNYGKKNMLPLEVSTIYEESEYVNHYKWEVYQYDSKE